MTPEFHQALDEIRAAFTIDKQLRHPHAVEQRGLLRHVLGEERFCAELAERPRWIEQNRTASFAFDVLADGTGREYRFESYYDAFLFKMEFGTRGR